MSIPKTILYPVDFSDRCRAVWPAVAAMAGQLDASLTLLHVLDIEHLDCSAMSTALNTIREHLREDLRNFPTPGLDVPGARRELAEGRPATCIVDRAEGLEAPLIMMPTRGCTRFRQLLLGSVTAAVLHDASCPVWTEVHAYNAAPGNGVCRAIVCAIDMGPGTPRVLQAASEFSEKFGVPLHIVHSVPGVDPRFSSAAADRAHAFLVDDANEQFRLYRQETGLACELEIVEDVGLVNGVAGALVRHCADLLIIGRGVMQGPLGRLRTNAHELIRRSPCPVLSV
jgi:nucleotide-binding universal stress UspA family protein